MGAHGLFLSHFSRQIGSQFGVGEIKSVSVHGNEHHLFLIKKTAGTFWDSMSDQTSVNRNTALEVSNFFNAGPFNKLTITNCTSGVSKHVPVTVIERDRDHCYDGKVLVTLALSELLKVKEGDQVRVEVVVGGGYFGWEGI